MTSRIPHRGAREWFAAASCMLLLCACKGDSPPKARVRPDVPEPAAESCHGTSGDPGTVTLHRLNRAEYDATVRDLLGDTSRPARGFPTDDHGYGFDNIADVLSLSPLLMEKYAAAAEKLVDDAWVRPGASPRVCELDATAPEPCAREILSRFARRAWRRPVTKEEVDRLLRFLPLAKQHGDPPEVGVKLALRSVLLSPHFLFRVEKDPDPSSTEPHRLTAFELASRLSYFLWSSMPDDELFEQARAGTLRANLRGQVGRMLDDPKSRAFVANFAGQWLQLRRLEAVAPDPDRFPGFDDALRAAMREETERLFAHVLREDRSVLELLDADYTFLNPALARHYGIDGVEGEGFRRVALPDGRRGGVLTQASVLTLTSNPNRTSPVKRGQFILQQLLGTPPPPPPPDVPELDADGHDGDPDASLRERMERHRADPQCASCHQQMDALGFALENYDAVGRWRSSDGQSPIDASGELSGGRAFRDAGELKNVLRATASRKFAQTLVKNLLTYALGRGLEPADYCTVEEVRSRLAGDGWRMRSAVLGVVESRAFQHRGVSP